MKNTFRKGLTLLMVLCMLVPLFGLSVLAADAEGLPIDYQFKDADVQNADGAQALAAGMTNDPYSAKQWGMKMIGMEAAWQSGLTGAGVRVAVIDGGVYTDTGDFEADRLLPGKNMVSEGESTEDSNGHGTFIAGIIGASKDNGVGIAGIAPGATIIPIKTSNDGSTQNGVSAQAFYAAVDEFHCDVINYSSGAKQLSSGIRDAVSYAVSKGVIVVCSTGNDGSTTLYYPGALEDTIGVGSVNKGMERSSFSHRNKSIFVVAPGDEVYSLGQGGSVRSSSGTSFSAPFVTGVAALLKEAHPEMNTADFKQILMRSSKDLGDAGYDVEYGYGLIQAPAAIRAAAEYFGTTAPDMPEIPEPTPDPSYNQTIWDQLFNFSWLRELFQNIIRSIFKGWSPNLTF
jgi:subtilisin family serine protease